MASLAVAGDMLLVRLSTMERLGAVVAHDPEAPLAAIRGFRVARPGRDAIRGMRAPGTGLPGVIALGHWRGRGHDFVAVYGNAPGIVVELEGRSYARFVVSRPDADAVASELERAGLRRLDDET